MMKVKLAETYSGTYLSLMCGLTFRKDGQALEVDESIPEVKIQLEQGYLEVVEINSEETKEVKEELKVEYKIITDKVPTKTIKEIVTPNNKEKIKEALNKDGDDKDKPKPENDFI